MKIVETEYDKKGLQQKVYSDIMASGKSRMPGFSCTVSDIFK